MLVIAYKTTKEAQLQNSHVGLGVCSLQTQKVLQAGSQITSQAMGVVDGFDLQNKLTSLGSVDSVVLQAPFFDTPFLRGLIGDFPRAQFTVVCHSNTGFLSTDSWSTRMIRQHIDLQQESHNFFVAGNSLRYCAAVDRAFGRPCAYLPNLYSLKPFSYRPVPCRGHDLKVGIFGATRIQKNQFNAVWAAIEIARRLKVEVKISINSGREETGKGVVSAIDELVAGIPGVSLEKIGWLSHSVFKSLVGAQDLLLSPSYTESHNIVTCDGIDEGVVSVVGPSVAWLPRKFQAEPDSVVDIAERGSELAYDRRAQKQAYEALQDFNYLGVRQWERVFA